jgi:hypothetical protein
VYNHTNTEETRGFRCPFVKKLGGDSLELLGFRSYYSYEPNKQFSTSVQGGFLNRIIISHKTGEQLDYLSVQGYNLLNSTGLGLDEQPKSIPNENLYYSFSYFPSSKENETLMWIHGYVDTKTLKKYYNFPPHNELINKAAPSISLNHIEPNGDRPSQYFSYQGILTIEPNTNVYFLRYLVNNVIKHRILKLDDWGNFISDTDITDQISAQENIVYWDKPEIIKGDKIRLQCRIPKEGFFEYGHQGYVELDFDGNLLKDNKEMVIDGFRPIFLKTIDLASSTDILHIFRPQENNNIYFYKEKPDGSYIKAGELINNNRPIYAFQPVIATQAKDGDLLVEFTVLLDSLVVGNNSFNTGGWGALIKIEAEELGITVPTKDQSYQENISIFPNPTFDKFQIKCNQNLYPINVQMFDMSGKLVNQQYITENDEINIENLQNGIYNVKIQCSRSDISPVMKKIVKIK